jgi:hypothetical protein
MDQNNEVTSISHAKTIEEISEFWDTHDATDFDDQTHDVEMEFDLRSRRHYIAIDPDVLTRLREAASARGLSAESLANLWLQERALSTTDSAKVLAEPRTKYRKSKK